MTKTIAAMALVAFTALPGIAAAGCSGYGHQEANLSCAKGTVWDDLTKSCVPSTS